ncbi:MAG: hypothetical protein CGW95_15325, partial [Phenylobacterium zucineum]
ARVLTASDDNTARIFDADSGDLLAVRRDMVDSWLWCDGSGRLVSIGPNAWKYLHGVVTDPNGRTRIVCPDLSNLKTYTAA